MIAKITTFNSWVPVRHEPSSASENVTTLLFGEIAKVLQETEEWLKIQLEYDQYVGWVGKEYVLESSGILDSQISVNKSTRYIGKGSFINVPVGGELPGSFITLGEERLLLENNSTASDQVNLSMIGEQALKQFLHAPYLWGGRSIHGIDCSGMVQVCMKIAGKKFPRDASQQAMEGDSIDFGDHQANDLVYFAKNERITHVGILLNKDQIIHASGRVRIDALTEQGIFNAEIQKITHVLHSIKRVAL